jgi:hypothetical protein
MVTKRWSFVRFHVVKGKITKKRRMKDKGSIEHKLSLIESGLEKFSASQVRHELGLKSNAYWRLKQESTQSKLKAFKELNMNTSRKRARLGKYHDLELKVLEWVDKSLAMLKQTKIGVSMNMILVKAAELAVAHRVSTFKANKSWFCRFVKRHNLKRVRMHGEALDVDLDSFQDEIADLKSTLSQYDPSFIFNMDETGLFYRYEYLAVFVFSHYLLIFSDPVASQTPRTCGSSA